MRIHRPFLGKGWLDELAAQLRVGWMAHAFGGGRAVARRRDRRGDRADLVRGRRHGRGAGLRPFGGRARVARAHVPPARADPEGSRPVPEGAQGRAVRAVRAHRCHALRLVDRRRRRLRRAARLRVQGEARAAERHGVRGRACRATGARRHVRRSAHLHAPSRCRGADQRLQLPHVGAAGEVRPRLHRGRAVADQARVADGLRDREAGRADARLRSAARGDAAAGLRVGRGSAGPPDPAGPGRVHRVGVDGPAPAHAPGRDPVVRAVQRRGRLAELLDPRPGRRRRYAGVRPVRRAAGVGDDDQGRPEVHGDPARAGARVADGRGGGGDCLQAGRGGDRQPGRQVGEDGRAGRSGAARGGASLAEGVAGERFCRLRRRRSVACGR